MKTIELTPKEYYIFKAIAKFSYKVQKIHKASIFIEADITDLSILGY